MTLRWRNSEATRHLTIDHLGSTGPAGRYPYSTLIDNPQPILAPFRLPAHLAGCGEDNPINATEEEDHG
jgi:hypothetical protein